MPLNYDATYVTFTATLASHYYGDIAIDDVYISNDPCYEIPPEPVPTEPEPTYAPGKSLVWFKLFKKTL